MLRWPVLPMVVLCVPRRSGERRQAPLATATTIDCLIAGNESTTSRPPHRPPSAIPTATAFKNRDELRLRTHPRRADTDRDRLRDGAEVRRFHTNPRKQDTDGDRYATAASCARERTRASAGVTPSVDARRRRRSRRVTWLTPLPGPGPTSCEPAATPVPVAGQGYVLRFSDCFGTLGRTVWCPNSGGSRPPPFGTQTVPDGELHLIRRRSDGYANTTMTTEPCGQANPKSFRQGYFEARLRFDSVRGNGPAFWLLSTRHATNPA